MARVVCWAIACSACLHVLTRVPGSPIGVTRLGSPASPRLVPVDAVACRAYRDPGVPTLLGPGPAVINTTSPKSRHSQKDTVRLNWLGTQNSGVPSDLEGGSNAAPAGPRKSLSAVAQPRLAKSLTPC